jgi:adenosylhomocysteinase
MDIDADADEGRRKIDWAREHTPILARLRERYLDEKPLGGVVVGMAMHVEAKTAVLAELLAEGGAEVAITGCNPLSTHDDVSAALDAVEGVHSYARHGVDRDEYYDALDAVIEHEPDVTVDDGGDLIFRIHEEYPELLEGIAGGCEETTTGVHRLRAMDDDDALRYPVFAVNDTPMKRQFDNVHGTGESSLSSIAMTTNLLFAGKTVVVGGYGHCGRGVAKKADGLGADVTVTEVDPRRALEAHMEGYDVAPMADAAEDADFIVTTTGNRDVVTREAFENMNDGVVLANAGHFDVEINLEELSEYAVNQRDVRDGVREYETHDGRRINVLAEGRLVNLATPVSLGHPAEVMDQSFGIQALCVERVLKEEQEGVHEVPDEIDRRVAEIKLDALDIEIDGLSDEQRDYMSSWQHGT